MITYRITSADPMARRNCVSSINTPPNSRVVDAIAKGISAMSPSDPMSLPKGIASLMGWSVSSVPEVELINSVDEDMYLMPIMRQVKPVRYDSRTAREMNEK